MTLFDEIDRDYEGPALYAEPRFTYLNRSARLEVGRIRDTLEEWFTRYPEAEKPDLRGRFRSTDDSQHHSAFFELLLHELFMRLGCDVELHPIVSGTANRPDFLVTPSSGNAFYIEAVLARDMSGEESAARARMNDVYDALNRLESPYFFIGMELRGVPETPPPARKIRSFLAKRLNQLDHNEISERYRFGGISVLPRWYYEHAGWRIKFFPIPKSPSAIGKTGLRPLGHQFYEIRALDSRIAIRDAILTKAGRYGELDLPYVVAVSVMSEFGVDHTDIMEALFGKEQYTMRFAELEPGEAAEPDRVEMTRVPDGVWMSRSGPRYTRVSAVLMGIQVHHWNVPTAPVCLYHNPWASRPYESVLTCLPQAAPQRDGRMKWQDGEPLGRIFDLPSEWPWE